MTVSSIPVVRAVPRALEHLGGATVMAGQILRVLPRPRLYMTSALQQAYVLGIQSLPLVLLMAFLGGAVTSQQTGAQFSGGLPLWVIGSVLAARVGASIAAELATMKVTEQVDALIAMGRDPVAFLVVPRVVAGALVFPPLVMLADAMGMFAGWGIGLLAVDGLTTADIVYGARFYFRPWALWFSVIKGGVFGIAITFIACYVGLTGSGGAEGVGRTTTMAVVTTTIVLMIIDVLMIPVLKAF